MLRLIATSAAFAACALGAGPRDNQEFEARTFQDGQGQVLPYRLLKPLDYDARKRYPLVLFLHGAGERGDDNQAQLKNAAWAFTEPRHRRRFQAFVVAPQCPAGRRWVEMDWGADSGVQPSQMPLVVKR